MALFSRKKQDGPDAIDDGPERIELERRPQTIGTLLAEARQRHGARIEDIGVALRIRPAFLQAIEDDQFGALPGPVYALGFVRTYADYLGLDGDLLARRFKTEIAGAESKRDFSFPMPLPERSLPGGAILLVALIVGACAYAVWYYRASGDHVRPERVAAVPQQLIPLPPPVPPAPPPSEAPAAESPTAAAPGAASSGPTSVLPNSAPNAAPLTPTLSPGSASAASSAPPPVQSAVPTAAPAPPVPSAPLRVAEPAPPPATVPPEPAPTSVAALPPPTAPAAGATLPASGTASAEPAIPAVPAAAPLPEGGRVFGITNGPVRIVIKAAGDSWVQVRDANGTAIQTRTLRSGDSLRVPDQPGLTVRAGNSGALQITLDGKPVPPIGPVGKARSASLDPAKLAAGTATLE